MTDAEWVDKLRMIAERLPGTWENRYIHEIVAEPWDSDGKTVKFEDCIYDAINLVEDYAHATEEG